MRWIAVIVLALVAVACGGAPAARARRTGPDVVTAEWTSGDDAVLPE